MIKQKFGGNPLPDPNIKMHKRNSMSQEENHCYKCIFQGERPPSNTKCTQKTRSIPSNNLIVSQWTQHDNPCSSSIPADLIKVLTREHTPKFLLQKMQYTCDSHDLRGKSVASLRRRKAVFVFSPCLAR